MTLVWKKNKGVPPEEEKKIVALQFRDGTKKTHLYFKKNDLFWDFKGREFDIIKYAIRAGYKWKKHKGSEGKPEAGIIKVRLRSGIVLQEGCYDFLRWEHKNNDGDIVAYQVEVDPAFNQIEAPLGQVAPRIELKKVWRNYDGRIPFAPEQPVWRVRLRGGAVVPYHAELTWAHYPLSGAGSAADIVAFETTEEWSLPEITESSTPKSDKDICLENAVCALETPSGGAKEADNVSHPSHYTAGGIECIDGLKSALTKEEFRGFLKGNILKYIWREKHKGGEESCQKARWYLNRLLEGE